MCQQFDPAFKQIKMIWHLISNIKNGQLAKKAFIYQKKKKSGEMFLKILWTEGFISGYKTDKKKLNELKIFLKYQNEKPVISSLKLVTKKKKNYFYSTKQIWKLNESKTFIIFSTNKGLKTIKDCKKLKIGGKPYILIN